MSINKQESTRNMERNSRLVFWPRCRIRLPAAAYTIETSRLYIVRYDAIVLLQRWQFSRVGKLPAVFVK